MRIERKKFIKNKNVTWLEKRKSINKITAYKARAKKRYEKEGVEFSDEDD